MPKGWQSIGDAVQGIVERLRRERGGNHGSSLIPRDETTERTARHVECVARIAIEIRLNEVSVYPVVVEAEPLPSLRRCNAVLDAARVQTGISGALHFAPDGRDVMTPYAPSPCEATGEPSRTCACTHAGESSPTLLDAGESDRPAGEEKREPVG